MGTRLRVLLMIGKSNPEVSLGLVRVLGSVHDGFAAGRRSGGPTLRLTSSFRLCAG